MSIYTKPSRSLPLGFAIALITLLFVDVAHAIGITHIGLVKFTLTAEIQQPSVEVRPGIFESKLTRVRITNKELLKNYLASSYPSAATRGARLVTAGAQLRIANAAGTVLDIVDAGKLKVAASPTPVQNGIQNNLLTRFEGSLVGIGTSALSVAGPNSFSLEGPLRGKYVSREPWQTRSYSAQMAGGGVIGGQNSFVFGDVTWDEWVFIAI